jgi:hypothetical protein
VKINPESEEYTVHKALLVHYSGFFSGALGSKAFKEAQDGVVTLDNVTECSLKIFLDLLYTGTIAPDSQWVGKYVEADLVDPESTSLSSSIIEAYIFADKYLVPDMQKFVMDVAVSYSSTRVPWYAEVTLAFNNLPANSPLLQLLVDMQCEQFNLEDADKEEPPDAISNLPPEFLYRVLMRTQELQDVPVHAVGPREQYNDPAFTGGNTKRSKNKHEEEGRTS